ncbi:MAG: RNA polymerase sigma factor [Ignavibacteria bacterium]
MQFPKLSITVTSIETGIFMKYGSKSEDIQLIASAKKGDQAAYEKLMRKYKSLIFNLVARVIKQTDDVEDLTQETFIKAFQSLERFDNQFSFSTWLFKIASNNCVDYLRKKKLKTFSIDKQIDTPDEEMYFEIPDTDLMPDKKIVDKERKQIIEEAIANLPEKYRKVILLRHSEMKEYEEIAEELNLPLGTVKAHIFRARELLNKFLKNKLGGL